MWGQYTGRSQRQELGVWLGKEKALWLETTRLRKERACCLRGWCWLFPSGWVFSPEPHPHFPLVHYLSSFPAKTFPHHYYLGQSQLIAGERMGYSNTQSPSCQPPSPGLCTADGETEKSFSGLLRTQHAANAALSTELKMSRCLDCQRLGLERRVHWHIDSPGHLALDYLLAGKPVYTIPYIFLQFNEVINAIKSYENINVRKHVA